LYTAIVYLLLQSAQKAIMAMELPTPAVKKREGKTSAEYCSQYFYSAIIAATTFRAL